MMFHVGWPIPPADPNGDHMKLARYRAALIPAFAAAITLGLSAGTAAAATSHSVPRPARVAVPRPARGAAPKPARAAAPRPARFTVPLPVAFNCWRAHMRPRNLYLACADGNNYLTKMSWPTWSRAYASATGTQMINSCVPYCASGRFLGYRVDVIFWRTEPVPHYPGWTYFSRVTLLYPGTRPPAFYRGKQNSGPETWTGVLPGN
jgi:hypothetical protein